LGWAMFWLSMAVLITALSVETGSAQGLSENKLLSRCRAFGNASQRGPLATFNEGYCGGFVAGIVFVDPKSCELDGVYIAEVARVVVAYIDQLPARQHEPFAILATAALRSAWPCKAAP